MDSTLGIVSLVCYLGGVCDFHNQLQTSITAKKDRIAGGLASFKNAFSGAAIAA